MSLYLKHRPRSFEQMLGNQKAISSLISIAKKKRRPHAFLFTGQAGCGKTTAARIMSKEMGADAQDIHEINSADFRGIETIRDLREKILFLPSHGEKSVYILDECHKLTNDAQNGLLKSLEEPPDHVVWFLCTTEPEKLLKTVRTRCTVVFFESMSDEVLLSLLKKICTKEKRNIPIKLLKEIANKAEGSPRQALSYLEQIIDIPEKEMGSVQIMYVQDQEKEMIDLCRALIAKKKWKEVSALLKELKADPEATRRMVLKYCSSVLLNGQERAYLVMEPFLDPFYEQGYARLVAACYEACSAE